MAFEGRSPSLSAAIEWSPAAQPGRFGTLASLSSTWIGASLALASRASTSISSLSDSDAGLSVLETQNTDSGGCEHKANTVCVLLAALCAPTRAPGREGEGAGSLHLGPRPFPDLS